MALSALSAICLLALVGNSFAASRLLAPAPGPSASSCQTALSIMASDPNLSAAYKNQILVNNVAKFSDPAYVGTLFVPTNAAHEAFYVLTGTSATVSPADIPTVKFLVDYHTVNGVADKAADLKDGLKLTTGFQLAPPLQVAVLTNGTVQIKAVASTATVIKADILACKAVIHIIDSILIPVRTA